MGDEVLEEGRQQQRLAPVLSERHLVVHLRGGGSSWECYSWLAKMAI